MEAVQESQAVAPQELRLRIKGRSIPRGLRRQAALRVPLIILPGSEPWNRWGVGSVSYCGDKWDLRLLHALL